MQAKDTDRIKIDDNTWRVECVQCGQRFEARRSDASFCSPRCRVAYSREPEKLNNAIKAIEEMSREIERLSSKYRHNNRVFEAVSSHHKRVNSALGCFEE